MQRELTGLAGVGPALAEKLARLGLHRVEDLLFLLPLRYEDRTELVPPGALRPGMRCLTSGKVLLAETVFRGRRSLLVRIGDGTGQLTLRFFHFSRQQQAQFRTGTAVSCYGDVRPGPVGVEMVHPEYRILKEGESPVLKEELTPVYPTTEGVQQGRLRNLTGQALRMMQSSPPRELLPAEIVGDLGMPSLADALSYLHRPPPDADLVAIESGHHPCRVRLAFEELLAHYLSLRALRNLARKESAIPLREGDAAVDDFISSLEFRLTGAQLRVVAEIMADLREPHPMMRLVQGDVGSGKTVVAAVACRKAIACGLQAAVMAPTELLAEQHLHNFSAWFRQAGLEVCWLSGSLRAARRRASLDAIASGNAQLVVGTHALFQEGVSFARLGLVVIDEQHRFGVHQRMALRFREEFVVPVEKSNDLRKQQKLHSLIEPFILRRTKSEVAKELPELTELVRYCEMSEEHRKFYEAKKSQIRNLILEQVEKQGMERSRFFILSSLMRLRLMANHPLMVDPEYAYDSGKFIEVRENIGKVLSEGHKVLIFSQFVKHLNIYRKYLDSLDLPYNLLTGQMPEKERGRLINDFQQDPEKRLFLISLKAGGLGLNLTGADYVFLLDPWWNPAVEKQAINRAHRIGQKKNVFVYKFITRDTVEEKILSLQQRKSALAGLLIDQNNPLKNLGLDEISDLIT